MDKKPYIYIEKRKTNKNKKSKPSKVLMGFALIIAFSLPYFLVKKFSHNTHQVASTKTIALPDLEDEDSEGYSDETFQESTYPNENTEEEIAEEPQPELNKESAKTIVEHVVKTVKPVKNIVKDNEWQTVRPRSGDSMATIFKRLGLTAQNLHLVMQKNPYAKALTAIKPSQELKFLINKNKLEKLVIPMNNIQTLTVYRDGAVYKTKIDSKKVKTQERYVTGVVKGSLYATAQRLGIPRKLIQQMTTILRKEIDFSRSIRSGDRFSIAYDSFYVENKMVGIGDIVAVSYTNQGKTAQAVRHISRNGTRDYYTPKGESFKKAFSRYPIKFSHISSTFTTSRYHPILHYKRAHKGIDLAAPIGTPIQSVGDGVITNIGRHNGYGNMIEVKHDKTYSTLYGHMLRFAKGLSKGSRIKRGQVIGYVGQTGLATGPHCHYELHVHNQPRNPTTTYLPTASPVPAREMAQFRAKVRNVFAQLKSLEKTNYAQKDNNKGKKKSKAG
ncbi:peptidoglycan DD-metalloendopeptidase family protein [Fluoribacter dumoffii]|nr:peptidoglycan DD-metalloendopeptidase family protein [Fluoribacter dumoffii]MCW8386452.1 peptidoglycan DD-metalloendopeptidase family protein [Fluoribacter dumoffii]MCW8419505.1 peptidoglycan DD-metalloendopeptidase family protein [Fluoribacter dumoffii]MCW8455792.1 peptidoglycan DD-metalloendopeptidase family protein [Fluoribacter dumoffii]MCW8460129.1 peptidoglycan DD-metalloendopeptidase family protein [Fluoribacter dumoffii]MCW8483608.1 peptidoglycan DD-metalloendopeptidase family prote